MEAVRREYLFDAIDEVVDGHPGRWVLVEVRDEPVNGTYGPGTARLVEAHDAEDDARAAWKDLPEPQRSQTMVIYSVLPQDRDTVIVV